MGSLHQALKEKRYHQFIYLVRLKANLEELDDQLNTPLITICSSIENVQIAARLLKALISNGANSDVEDEEGLSPLHIACKRNKPELIRILLKLIPDCPANTTDMYGNTPLHYAASSEETIAVSLILPLFIRYQVDTDVRNELGFTPLLIAASNGRLEVARYISDKVPVSTHIFDSLYFLSLDDWFHVYFDWPVGESILSPKTEVTCKNNQSVAVYKRNLVPVATKPAVNKLLENYSRENSAVQRFQSRCSKYSRQTIPKIVITSATTTATARRPKTAPESREFRVHTRRRDVNNMFTRSKDQRITLKMNSLTQHLANQRLKDGYQNGSTSHFNAIANHSNKMKMTGTCWGSVVELSTICSDQLSDAYRKTIVPVWPPPPEPKEDLIPPVGAQTKQTKVKEHGSRAASILLGMLGKGRRLGSESSLSIDDDAALSPKSNIKVKLQKIGVKKGAMAGDEKKDEDMEDRERVEKAAAILNRVMQGKKRLKPTVVQTQSSVNSSVPSSP